MRMLNVDCCDFVSDMSLLHEGANQRPGLASPATLILCTMFLTQRCLSLCLSVIARLLQLPRQQREAPEFLALGSLGYPQLSLPFPPALYQPALPS